MSEQQWKYDSTVARIAGNILSGVLRQPNPYGTIECCDSDVEEAVRLARAIVAEVQRTTPEGSTR